VLHWTLQFWGAEAVSPTFTITHGGGIQSIKRIQVGKSRRIFSAKSTGIATKSDRQICARNEIY
jgi:hypothetical protein